MSGPMTIPALTIIDILAFAVFATAWLAFGLGADRLGARRPHLMASVRTYRRRWIERTCERDNHTADATLLSNLLRGSLFFASTTVLILGGLTALLGTAPKVAAMAAQLNLSGRSSDVHMTELKAIVLLLVFVYAFFKFTWSAWQYNIHSILIGAAPDPGAPEPEKTAYVDSASRMAALAGESYNNGIRAYYFAIPLMTWFLDPVWFLLATLTVALVLYRREFHSPTLAALQHGKRAPDR